MAKSTHLVHLLLHLFAINLFAPAQKRQPSERCHRRHRPELRHFLRQKRRLVTFLWIIMISVFPTDIPLVKGNIGNTGPGSLAR
jgi:hypothetical protein